MPLPEFTSESVGYFFPSNVRSVFHPAPAGVCGRFQGTPCYYGELPAGTIVCRSCCGKINEHPPKVADDRDLTLVFRAPSTTDTFHRSVTCKTFQTTVPIAVHKYLVEKVFSPCCDCGLDSDVRLEKVIAARANTYSKAKRGLAEDLHRHAVQALKNIEERNFQLAKIVLRGGISRYKFKELDITLQKAEETLRLPCVYCGEDRSQTVVSLDRFVNTDGYIPGNVVCACLKHNTMKWDLSAASFIKGCNNVANFAKDANIESCDYDIAYKQKKGLDVKTWRLSFRRTGYGWKKGNLTDDAYERLTKESCHYCGKPSVGKMINGVDRKDASGRYDVGNVVPCCPVWRFSQSQIIRSVNDIYCHRFATQ